MSDNKIHPNRVGVPRVQPAARIEPRDKNPQPKPRPQPKDTADFGKGDATPADAGTYTREEILYGKGKGETPAR